MYRFGYNKNKRNFKEFHRPREFVNPYFNKRPGTGKKSIRLKIDIILFILVLAGWIYFLFSSPCFLVKDISISGSNQIPKGELIVFTNNNLGKNIFLINRAELARSIAAKFITKETDVQKIYPANLTINITERQPVFNIAYNNHLYLLDADGVIYRDLWEAEAPTSTAPTSTEIRTDWPEIYKNNIKNARPLLIYNLTKNTGALGDLILKPKIISDISKIFEIEKISGDFKIKCVFLKEGNPTQLAVVLQNGIELYFDAELDIGSQIENLHVVLSEKLGQKINGLKYIDLRFGERVYYK